MSTKNPRVMVVLENPLLKWVKKTAKADGISLSLRLRDLVREAYESCEDRYWSQEGEKRLSKNQKNKTIPHEDFWKKLGV